MCIVSFSMYSGPKFCPEVQNFIEITIDVSFIKLIPVMEGKCFSLRAGAVARCAHSPTTGERCPSGCNDVIPRSRIKTATVF